MIKIFKKNSDVRLRKNIQGDTMHHHKNTRGPTRPGVKKLGAKARNNQGLALSSWLSNPVQGASNQSVPAPNTAVLATGTMATLSWTRPGTAGVGAGTSGRDPASQPAVLATRTKTTLSWDRPGTAGVEAGSPKLTPRLQGPVTSSFLPLDNTTTDGSHRNILDPDNKDNLASPMTPVHPSTSVVAGDAKELEREGAEEPEPEYVMQHSDDCQEK